MATMWSTEKSKRRRGSAALNWRMGKTHREFWETGLGRAGTEKDVQVQMSAEKKRKGG